MTWIAPRRPRGARIRHRRALRVPVRVPLSPVRRYTPAGQDVDGVLDVRAVFQQGHRDLALDTLPSFLLPRKGRYGLCDYEKIFCPDLRGGHDIFDLRGIDRERGCRLVVQPDQSVAHVLPLEAHAELAAFFDGFMLSLN